MRARIGAAADVERLAELVRAADRVVALTGAGISVPSGIPDFRSPGTGIWENVDPMEVAHIDAFRSDPARFWSFYGRRFASLRDKRPNGAHTALVELERRGLLDAVITQNIDTLHRKAGTSELVEVHGVQRRETMVRMAEHQHLLGAERAQLHPRRCVAGVFNDSDLGNFRGFPGKEHRIGGTRSRIKMRYD